jgi:preprotein translocase subunit Sec61beta
MYNIDNYFSCVDTVKVFGNKLTSKQKVNYGFQYQKSLLYFYDNRKKERKITSVLLVYIHIFASVMVIAAQQ